MNERGEQQEPDDPSLSNLCDPDDKRWNAAWEVAHVKLHGTAFAKITKMLGQRGASLVDDIYMKCVRETRKGIEELRNSPDRNLGEKWKEIQDFRDLRNMFSRIVECRTNDYLRKHWRETDYEDALDHPAPDGTVARDFEWQQALEVALGRLPPKLRDVLVARDVKRLAPAEVMRMYNLTEEALNTRISRAKKKLREIIERDSELVSVLWPKQLTAGTTS